jgi:hypothetical protein
VCLYYRCILCAMKVARHDPRRCPGLSLNMWVLSVISAQCDNDVTPALEGSVFDTRHMYADTILIAHRANGPLKNAPGHEDA